jgi:hypothetical protein
MPPDRRVPAKVGHQVEQPRHGGRLPVLRAGRRHGLRPASRKVRLTQGPTIAAVTAHLFEGWRSSVTLRCAERALVGGRAFALLHT